MESSKDNYWFIGNQYFEQAQTRQNRLVVNFRYSDGNDKISSSLLLNQNIIVPTKPIGRFAKLWLKEVVNSWENDLELGKCRMKVFIPEKDAQYMDAIKNGHPGLEIEVTKNNKYVFQIEIPNDKRLEDRLPRYFQTGMHDLTFRYDHDWLLRKVNIDPLLEQALVNKEQVDFIIDDAKKIADFYHDEKRQEKLEREIVKFLGLYSGKVVAEDLKKLEARRYPTLKKFIFDPGNAGEVDKLKLLKIRLDRLRVETDGIIKRLDPGNYFEYGEDAGDFELYLNSRNGFVVDGPRLTEKEVREQVSAHYDIETCMFRYPEEERDLLRREYTIALKNGNGAKVEKAIQTLEEKLEKKASPRKKVEIAKEAAYLREVSNFNDSQLDDETGNLERSLTINVAGYEVKLFDEKYADVVHVFPIRIEYADERVEQKLFTIVDPGMKIVNGYEIVVLSNSRKLHNAINRKKRKARVFREINHKLDFDVIHSRDDAVAAGADPYDHVVRGKKPGKDVSVADFYIRLRQNAVYQDTFRGFFDEVPFRKGHTLEDYVEFYLGEGIFEKPEGVYKSLREWYVQAVNGVIDGAVKLSDYATKDVDADSLTEKKTSHLGRTLKVLELAPFLTLTQALFSAGIWRKDHDYLYWNRIHCHKNYGIEQKIENERRQIFDKRFPAILRDKLKNEGINTSPIRGVYSKVLEAYFPIEYLLRDRIIQIDPKFENFFKKLPNEFLARFAMLRYAWSFFSQVLQDYNAVSNMDVRIGNKLKRMNMPVQEVHGSLDEIRSRADDPDFSRTVDLQGILREDWRSIYVNLNGGDRKLIRVPRLKKARWQGEFGFIDFREIDQEDLRKLKEQVPNIVGHSSKGMKYMLSRFLTNFTTYERLLKRIAGYAYGFCPPGVPEEKLAYMALLREEFVREEREFIELYGIRANSGDSDNCDSLRKDLREVIYQLRDDIRKSKSIVVDTNMNGRYLYLFGGDAAFGEYPSLLPLRIIKNHVITSAKKENKGQGELFKEEEIVVPESEFVYLR